MRIFLINIPLISLSVFLLIAGLLFYRLMKRGEGADDVRGVAGAIRSGMRAFFRVHHKYQLVYTAVVAALLALEFILIPVFEGTFGSGRLKSERFWLPVLSFLSGVFLSNLVTRISVSVSSRSNARTAFAMQHTLNSGLRTALNAGIVISVLLAVLALIGLVFWYRIASKFNMPEMIIALFSFVFGASSSSAFLRLGGGAFAKSADIGADIVRRMEAGLATDDPRNPAAIADAVGDNTGNLAGASAEIFEAVCAALASSMILAHLMAAGGSAMKLAAVPLLSLTFSIPAALIGTMVIKTRDAVSPRKLLMSVRRGIILTTLLLVSVVLYINVVLFPQPAAFIVAILLGLGTGFLISFLSQYFTSDLFSPARSVADGANDSAAVVISRSMTAGFRSVGWPSAVIVTGILLSFYLAGGGIHGLYGISLFAVGILLPYVLFAALNCYGPIVDNAYAIAAMTHQEPEILHRATLLDALGNTTATAGKAHIIAAAAVSSVSLLAALAGILPGILTSHNPASTLSFQLADPVVLAGIFLGGILPFILSARSLSVVARTSGLLVQEVRRQFKEIRGILDGSGAPDYPGLVRETTRFAYRSMLLSLFLIVTVPQLITLILGPLSLFTMVAGVTSSGFALALMMANTGGVLDNAKKFIEQGNHGGRGSEAHLISRQADNFGDAFKDAAGPAINILVKLTAITSIVFGLGVIRLHQIIREWIF